jgi:hypothetical protein
MRFLNCTNVTYKILQNRNPFNIIVTKRDTVIPSIPKPLEAACFRKFEKSMIKATLFINGYSLKKRDNAEHDLLRLPIGLVYKRFTLRY